MGIKKLSCLVTVLDTLSRVLPDYRSLKDFKRFLTHFDSMSVYSDRSRWGREFVVNSQFVKILELSTWALKLRTDMVQSHWGGGNIHKWYRHTSGGVVGHINPIFCLHAFVMILKCGAVVVAVTSNLHSHWCQQLFQEKKKCNYWQSNFVLTQNYTSLLFRPLLCNIL